MQFLVYVCVNDENDNTKFKRLESFEGLDGVGLDDLAGGLGLEHHLLTGERVAAHARPV